MIPWFTLFDLLYDWNKHLFSDILNMVCIRCPPETKRNNIANLRENSLRVKLFITGKFLK